MAHYLRAGDDHVFVYTSQDLFTGPGADRIVICELDKLSTSVWLGGDIAADAVVVHVGRLNRAVPDGHIRKIIFGMASVNDRVILRVPPALDVSYREDGRIAVVGNIEVQMRFSGWLPEPRPGKNAFIVEAVAAEIAPAEPASGSAPEVSLECPESDAQPVYAEGQPELSGTARSYTPGDDMVLVDEEPVIFYHHTGDGNDLVHIIDPAPGMQVETGDGADTIVVCSMLSLSLSIFDGAFANVERDTVVLGPNVFDAVPRGFTRRIIVFGLDPGDHRLILRLPHDQTVDVQRDRVGESAEITVNNVVVNVLPPSDSKGFTEEHLTVERIDGVMPRNAPDVPRLDGAVLQRTCPDHEAETFTMPLANDTDTHMRVFGAGSDRILVGADPDVFRYLALGGNDEVFIVDPLANIRVALGNGSDVAIVCSMTDLAATIGMGGLRSGGPTAHDVDPDVVIVSPQVFRDVSVGSTRQITVHGVVESMIASSCAFRPEWRLRSGTTQAAILWRMSVAQKSLP